MTILLVLAAQWEWERHPKNPVLTWEQLPAREGALYPVMGDPFILIDDGVYKLWFGYGGLDDAGDEESVAVRTAYAESSDGVTWTVTAPALDLGTGWDRTNAETPCVLKDPDLPDGDPRRYRLYYSGLDRAVESLPFEKLVEIGMGYGIGLAFSSDGKTFTRLPAEESPHGVAGLVVKPDPPKEGPNWDLIHVSDPHVVLRDGTYHLWYTSFSFDDKPYLAISYATSRDGIRWEKHGHAIKPELEWETARANEPHLGRPYVQWTGKRFEMLYDCVAAEGDGSAGVGFAWSEDGRAWTKADAPVFTGNGGAGERAGLMIGTAWFEKDGRTELIYGGYDPDVHHVVFNRASAKRP